MANCQSCRFSKETHYFDVAECRRHAPMDEDRGSCVAPRYIPRWPRVSLSDWCGDYEPRSTGDKDKA